MYQSQLSNIPKLFRHTTLNNETQTLKECILEMDIMFLKVQGLKKAVNFMNYFILETILLNLSFMPNENCIDKADSC